MKLQQNILISAVLLALAHLSATGQMVIPTDLTSVGAFGTAPTGLLNQNLGPVMGPELVSGSPDKSLPVGPVFSEKVAFALESVGAVLNINLGSVALQPNQAGQTVDFFIQNTGSSSLDNIFGLNFSMQVGDGTSGPQVQAVSLHDGNSSVWREPSRSRQHFTNPLSWHRRRWCSRFVTGREFHPARGGDF
jgi:hypothetical protein